jgi:L-ascorbate metabolism protein UlaG (beta-lactamase superfamily)
MDIQYYGANCVTITYKGRRIVIDDNLSDLGAKSIMKPDDVALFTSMHQSEILARLMFDGPGEYEVSDISVIGFSVRAHIDEQGQKNAIMFKLVIGDRSVLVTGHIYPELTESQLEAIGMVDILIVPVGGNGYTIDPIGALKLIKIIEPKVIVPTHYADSDLSYPVPQQDLAHALKEIGMEPKETVSKLRLKNDELSDVSQLIVLEKSN